MIKKNINMLKQHWQKDLFAGFIISLIALPLCLGISMASGVPPIAGIFAGIIGGIIVSLISGSQLTINGPAAGLAIIVFTTMEGFKKMAPAGLNEQQIFMFAYQCTLGVGLACGIVQILFGFIKAGVLSNFFPSTVVHGMLASIGITIIIKQIFTAVGNKSTKKEMLDIVLDIPRAIYNFNPEITLIAIISLILLIIIPKIKHKIAKIIPVPLLVVIVAIILGYYFDLADEHHYHFFNHDYTISPIFLVNIPAKIKEAIVFPRFDYLFTGFGIKMVFIYSLVASLESLLTASAIDKLDPLKRHTNFNKELFGKGIGNIISSLIGGLPIIAEVVRSSANVNNKAQTKFANFFHGIFLLIFLIVLTPLIHHIPLSALAALLILTGYKLSSPKEFIKTYEIGKEQLVIFIITIIFSIYSDLLIGILAGITVKIIFHLINGVSLSNLFKPIFTVSFNKEKNEYTIDVEHSLVFSNFLLFKKHIENIPFDSKIKVDFKGIKFIDHTTYESLESLKLQLTRQGRHISLIGISNKIK